MLVRSGELRSRLLGHVVPLPYIYIGQHWRTDARSRWSAVMPSRFSVIQDLARQQRKDWCQPSTELCVVRDVGLPF